MSPVPRSEQPWHHWDIPQVVAKLETTEQGLSYAIARQRLRQIGRNIFPKPPKLFDLWRETCYDPRVVAILLSALLLQWAGELGWVVLLALGLNIAFVVGIKYWVWQLKQRATLARWHRRPPDPTAIVLRDQQWMEISSRLLVPGDFLFLQTGDHPPADVRLVSASPDLCADETMLGNSAIACKQADTTLEVATPPRQRSNMVYAGSTITAGQGAGLVVGTAQDTYWLSHGKPQQFWLQLSHESVIVGAVAVVVALFALNKGWSYSLLLVTALILAYGAVPQSLLDQLLQYLGIKFLAQQRIEVGAPAVITKLGRIDSLEILPSQTTVKLDQRLFAELKIQLTTTHHLELLEAETEQTAETGKPSTQATAVYGSEIADLEYLTSAFLSFSDRRCPVPVQRTVDVVLPRPDLSYLYTAIAISRHLGDRLNRLHLFLTTNHIGLLLLVSTATLAPLPTVWVGAIAIPLLCGCFVLEPIATDTAKPVNRLQLLPLAIATIATSGSTLALFWLKYQGQPEALLPARTMAFTTFFLSQCFHAIALSRSSLLGHWLLPLTVAGLTLAQVLLTQWAVFADAMGTVPLNTADWLIVSFAATSILWAQEIMRQS